jgi:DNA topoisomerase III
MRDGSTSGISIRGTPAAKLGSTMSLPESGTIAIRAEKPSVARDIARVLGATNKGESYLHGNGYVVAWACRPLGECTPSWLSWTSVLVSPSRHVAENH